MSHEHPQNTAIELVQRQITELAIVEGYVIKGMEEAQGANEALGKVKSLSKMIAEAKDGERRPLNDQLKAISARYAPAEQLLSQAEMTLKSSLLTFQRTEERRLAEQRRIEQEAAAKEKARLEEAARKEREAAEAKATKFREAGKDERADAVLATAESSARAQETVAAMVAAPSKPVEAPKFSGMSVRKVWKAKVDNMPKFLAALANSHYPIDEFVTVNQAALNKLAGSLQKNMDKAMPGTFAWEEEVVGARAR